MEKRTLVEINLQDDGSLTTSCNTRTVFEMQNILASLSELSDHLFEQVEQAIGIKPEDAILFKQIKDKLESKKSSSTEEKLQILKDFKAILDGR